MARDWAEFEDEAVVTDYFAMLAKELREEPYSKAAHRRSLKRLLDHRSDSSIEFKHQNISATMIELGYPYISGYKPRWNYQARLARAVKARLEVDHGLVAAVSHAVDAKPYAVDLADMTGRVEEPPDAPDVTARDRQRSDWSPRVARSAVDYLERESRNQALGRSGEIFAVEFERARLREAGRERLARQVDHVAVSRGDGLGYDILSFEEDGSDRGIEVKTTRFGKETPFFVSRNELGVSETRPEYHLYRVFAYPSRPRLYILRGPLDRMCRLEPTHYVARCAM